MTTRQNELDIPFVSRDTLIAMKRAVGRTQDLLDVEKLEAYASDEPSS